MARKRVIALFMHESEAAAARARMTSVEETDAYLIGNIDEADAGPLRKDGLIIVELEDARTEEDGQAEPAVLADFGAAAAPVPGAAPPVAARVERKTNDDPAYYALQLRGPLLESWRKTLETAGAKVVQSLPDGSMLMRLTSVAAEQVAQLGFVKRIREHGPDDTPLQRRGAVEKVVPPVRQPEFIEDFGVASLPGPAGLAAAPANVLYDVRVHEPAGRGAVEQWLGKKGVAVVGTGRWKIRIAAVRDAPMLDDLRALSDVAVVEEYVPPTLCNEIARQLLGLDSGGGAAGAALPYLGTGQVVGIADTGLDTTHPDFPAARVKKVIARGRPGQHDDPDGHGTHVAGSVLGDGSASNGTIRGTAPAATVVFQSLLDAAGDLGGLPVDLEELFLEAYNEGVRIHNNSWGANTAAYYRLNSREVDEFVWSHPDMLLVFAAGNAGQARPVAPAVSARTAMGNVDWLSVGSPATAKNALVVGASRTRRTADGYAGLSYGAQWGTSFPCPRMATELISGDPDCLAGFSSRGPCIDNRIKPDVVAPGTDIASTRSALAPLSHFWGPYPGSGQYAFMGGTSMATPLVTGCAALVREYYTTGGHGVFPAHAPSAALLKATLVNGTRWLAGWDAIADHPTQPNYHQGFGAVFMPTTLPNPAVQTLQLVFWDPWQTPGEALQRSGQRRRFVVDVKSGTPLRITIAYTDLPGAGRQNHLNLFVEHSPTRQRWEGNSALPSNDLKVPDPYNNVQILRLDAPAAGQYLIQVTAIELLAPQAVAMVVTGDLNGGLTPA